MNRRSGTSSLRRIEGGRSSQDRQRERDGGKQWRIKRKTWWRYQDGILDISLSLSLDPSLLPPAVATPAAPPSVIAPGASTMAGSTLLWIPFLCYLFRDYSFAIEVTFVDQRGFF